MGGVIREKTFSKISLIEDLKFYLDDVSGRLNSRNYFYHYTTLDKVFKIFESRKWHLGNAKCMNDRLEYSNGDIKRWENIFFASFMTDIKENIGMWSMYAQPWKNGVLITIPKRTVIDWIRNTKNIFDISCTDFMPTGKTIAVDNENRVFLSAVAYSNCDSSEGNEKLTWSNTTNEIIKNATHIPELTGYIKDSAWDYEREIRIKAVLKEGHGCSRVALEIPEHVLDSITITAGPLFEGKLENRLNDTIRKRAKVSNSLFSEKFIISSACSGCSSKKQRKNDKKQIGDRE